MDLWNWLQWLATFLLIAIGAITLRQLLDHFSAEGVPHK